MLQVSDNRMVRAGGPAALALFAVVGALMSVRPASLAWGCAAVAVLTATVLSVLGVGGWPLAAGFLVPAAALTVAGYGQASNLAWMGFCVLGAWAGLAVAPPAAAALGVVLFGTVVWQFTLQTSESGWVAWGAGTVFSVIACIFARRLRLTIDQLKAAQEKLARQSREEERARIAGEVHDVIGHGLTVVLLHISSARLALDEPGEADRALAEAERLARSSLDEVRATVGLMRSDDGSSVAPLPAAPDIPALVESYRRAGTPITLDIAGELDSIGPTRGLAAYRVVQESLTNAIRHAPGSAVTVRIDASGDALTVCVDNPGDFGSSTASGTGLVAMAERAEAVGGRVRAGARSGGWRVEAVLPR